MFSCFQSPSPTPPPEKKTPLSGVASALKGVEFIAQHIRKADKDTEVSGEGTEGGELEGGRAVQEAPPLGRRVEEQGRLFRQPSHHRTTECHVKVFLQSFGLSNVWQGFSDPDDLLPSTSPGRKTSVHF